MPEEPLPLRVEHHFESAAQQRSAVLLGMWLFLAGEVLFFGGLFGGYAVCRLLHPQAFAEASRRLDLLWGSVNTALLLGSGLTMSLAVEAGKERLPRPLLGWLGLTLLLGTAFLGIKFSEYHAKFVEHLVPGAGFSGGGDGAQLFFYLYFVMTGIHAVHLLVGLGAIACFMARVKLRPRLLDNPDRIAVLGLYWHFVDLVWIFLFPLLYLVQRHS